MTWSPAPDAVSGTGYDRHDREVGVAREDRLDRTGREVLRVDAEPVAGPTGEVEEAVAVDVPEVPGPVPAAPQPFLLGVVAPVVPLELAAPAAVDDLADGLARVERADPRRRTRRAGMPRPSRG